VYGVHWALKQKNLKKTQNLKKSCKNPRFFSSRKILGFFLVVSLSDADQECR